MQIPDKFRELWTDWLEGELDSSGLDELQQLLASDASLLEHATESYRTHRLLGLLAVDDTDAHDRFVDGTVSRLPQAGEQFVDDVLRRLPESESPSPAAEVPPRSTRHGLSSWLAWGAVAASLIGWIWLLPKWTPPPRADSIARITELNGSLRWTGDEGQVDEAPDAGQALGGGTLETLSVDAWVSVEFHDGSEISLSRQSRVTLSEDEQKTIHLLQGHLAAVVEPQPEGKPFLVRTPSASLEVQGTRFDVFLAGCATILSVNEGLVRATRHADRSSVDVSEGHYLVVSVNHENALRAGRFPQPVNHWQSDLIGGSDNFLGRWTPARNDLPERLQAVPIAWPVPNEAPITLWATSLAVEELGMPPVLIEAGSVFRVRGRADRRHEIRFGVDTHKPRGGFNGKLQVLLPANTRETDEFDVEIPVEALSPVDERSGCTAVGMKLKEVFVYTVIVDADLEVMSVELRPGPG